ncbi:MAG: DEAD/DEAH box helicase [Xanthomonadales bacterium]|jgi:ATP-dependent RNA helicase RhlB|nr:DEAD/DEAH box helicase [Xanthomonadales bacterium]
MSDRILTDLDFQSLALHPTLQEGLAAAGFERLTPIQARALPLALAGRDVAGQAQTGTGKTLAFLVALMQRLLSRPARAERRDCDPRALILAPTRELAVQIHADAMKIIGPTGLKAALAFGGVDYEKQARQFEQGCDLLIGTPGRTIDFLKQSLFKLSSTDVVVMDEADRMFDLGFINDIRYMLRRCAPTTERLSMLFSATLGFRVLELAYEHMNDPERIVIESPTLTAARVVQSVYFPASDEKADLLLGLVATRNATRTIIFVNTKHAADRVQQALERAGLATAILSGDVPQNKRLKLLEKFKDGTVEFLVATDVAARGLHIENVSHVINYDLPVDPDDYVHRVGRTARFGASGDAVSFACERYAVSLPDIEKHIGHRIEVHAVTAELLAAKPQRSDKPLLGRQAEPPPPAARGREGARPGASGGGRSSGSRDSRSSGSGSRGRSDGRRPAGERRPRPTAAVVTADASTGVPSAAVPVAALPTAPIEPAIHLVATEAPTGAADGTKPATGEAPAKKRRRRRRRGGGATGEAGAADAVDASTGHGDAADGADGD